jgi:hypothetical protein
MVHCRGAPVVRLKEKLTMPRNKDLKRLVRARMSKTGESYTAARAKVVSQSSSVPPVAARPAVATRVALAPREPRVNHAELAGMSDDAIKAKTGRTWVRWVGALDHVGADKLAHRDIAALVSQQLEIGAWWAQAVTVGYERIKGLRARGQRRDGSYEANKSRTYNVPVATLFAAWANTRTRRRWLDGGIGRVRTSTRERSMRLDGRDGTIVSVGFTAKGPGKSAVAVEHSKLRDAESARAVKQYWSERLDALGTLLASA